MCNPRKITVRATRKISQAWREVIRRTAQLGGTVTGRAELSQPLGSMLAEPARRAFEQAVASDPRWELRDGAYYLAVTGGEACYRPDTRNLEVSVELSAYIEVQGAASQVVEGTVEETVEATAEAQYYTDGYGGRTSERAQSEATALAEAEAERQAQARAESVRQERQRRSAAAAAASSGDVQRAAESDARTQLSAESHRRSTELTAEAELLLDRVHQESMRGVWETVAAGYQNVLLAYARANGARDIGVSRLGSSVQIQFQMEA